MILPRDVLKFGPEGLVEPAVEDGIGEGGGHPDEVHEGEADAAYHVTLKIGPSIGGFGLEIHFSLYIEVVSNPIPASILTFWFLTPLG